MATPLHVLDVAVIGAGISGLNCARRLAEAGIRVAVFDKARGVGGRMATRRGAIVNHDHGAQYFTARDPVFRAWVADREADGTVAEWNAHIVAFDATGCREIEDEIRYAGVPGMSGVCRKLLGDVPFFAEHRLMAMARDGQGWRLDFENGETAACRQLVLALPAVQASELLGVHAEFQRMAASVAMQPCWALMLRLEQPLAPGFDAAFVNTGPLSWIARNSSKPGRPAGEAWVLHGSVEWSSRHLESDVRAVETELMAAFAGLIQMEVRPAEINLHRWRFAQIAQALKVGAAYDAATGLGMAGDWLNGGRVEGAWCSGYQLAAQILDQPLVPAV